MPLKSRSKRIIKTIAIGLTTVMDVHVYDDGTTSKPIVKRSYNFVPDAQKKKKKVIKKQNIEIEETEER